MDGAAQWVALGLSVAAVLLALRAVRLSHRALRRSARIAPLPETTIALPRAKQAAGGIGGHVTVLPKASDPDYSPEFQDEYQRLWHEAAAERDRLQKGGEPDGPST